MKKYCPALRSQIKNKPLLTFDVTLTVLIALESKAVTLRPSSSSSEKFGIVHVPVSSCCIGRTVMMEDSRLSSSESDDSDEDMYSSDLVGDTASKI